MRDRYGYLAIDSIWLGLKQFSCLANTSNFQSASWGNLNGTEKKTSTIIWTRAGRPQGRLSGYLISPRHHRTWAYLCSASLQNKEPSSKYLCFQSISGKKKKAAAENSNLALNKCFLQTSDDAFRPCLTPPKVCTQNSPHPRLAGCYWHQCHFYGYWH